MARPQKPLDESLIRALAEIQCTVEEIAAVVGCNRATLHRRGYATLIKEWAERGRSSLRRAQWKAAMGGNPTMLIWMGKQILGQTDKSDLTTRDKTLEDLLDEAATPQEDARPGLVA